MQSDTVLAVVATVCLLSTLVAAVVQYATREHGIRQRHTRLDGVILGASTLLNCVVLVHAAWLQHMDMLSSFAVDVLGPLVLMLGSLRCLSHLSFVLANRFIGEDVASRASGAAIFLRRQVAGVPPLLALADPKSSTHPRSTTAARFLNERTCMAKYIAPSIVLVCLPFWLVGIFATYLKLLLSLTVYAMLLCMSLALTMAYLSSVLWVGMYTRVGVQCLILCICPLIVLVQVAMGSSDTCALPLCISGALLCSAGLCPTALPHNSATSVSPALLSKLISTPDVFDAFCGFLAERHSVQFLLFWSAYRDELRLAAAAPTSVSAIATTVSTSPSVSARDTDLHWFLHSGLPLPYVATAALQVLSKSAANKVPSSVQLYNKFVRCGAPLELDLSHKTLAHVQVQLARGNHRLGLLEPVRNEVELRLLAAFKVFLEHLGKSGV